MVVMTAAFLVFIIKIFIRILNLDVVEIYNLPNVVCSIPNFGLNFRFTFSVQTQCSFGYKPTTQM